jgi:NADH pyrophosphatase NudC (nudix superfamily)
LKGVDVHFSAMTLPRDLALRCPYCVTGYEFRIMEVHEKLRICTRCGHMAREDDPWFQCVCKNCVLLKSNG